ncbi:hypothetical protein GC176_10350 [bacterium]|nr:hypothetical protein [bacterium]
MSERALGERPQTNLGSLADRDQIGTAADPAESDIELSEPTQAFRRSRTEALVRRHSPACRDEARLEGRETRTNRHVLTVARRVSVE